MKKTIIFDLGGVLIDWNPRHLYRKIFADQGEMEFFLSQVCTPDWNAQMDRGYPFKTAVGELTDQHPKYTLQIQAFFGRWEEMILGSFPETVKILGVVKAAGYPVAGLTNWSGETFPRVAHRFEFLGWFDPLIVSGKIGMVKPDPEIYHYLLKMIQRVPEKCIFIDDNEINIQTAEELGFECIHFFSPIQLRSRLEELEILINNQP
ncbi:MAG: HAD family phosphatase [Anaerolineales bacterium]